MTRHSQEKHFRALFISHVHLGTRGCQADILLDFLRFHDAGAIYLVGDIVDGWRLKRNWYWPQQHNDVVQKFLRKARKGARIVYVPGNHDEFLRSYSDADVFVFPSLTDTFGNVILEGLASGLPVAAFPVTGPKDILVEPGIGALDDDLQMACLRAAALGHDLPSKFALHHSWEESARTFKTNIVPAHGDALDKAA